MLLKVVKTATDFLKEDILYMYPNFYKFMQSESICGKLFDDKTVSVFEKTF